MTSGLFRHSIFNKEQEFRAWLVEERKMNPERMSKDQNKKEFARFVEDYNTGLSSIKFLSAVIDDRNNAKSSQPPCPTKSFTT
jgi:hypothetical protein